MDVAGIEPGRDFRCVIDRLAASCGELLAVIGRNWLGVAGTDGRRRLDNPLEFVRIETSAALRRGIPVVPVLVHEARMPRPEHLPEELKDLAYRNAVELSHTRWDSDLGILVRSVHKHLDAQREAASAAAPEPAPAAQASPAVREASPEEPRGHGRRRWVVFVGLAAALVAVGAVSWIREGILEAQQRAAETRRLVEQKEQAEVRIAAEQAEHAAREREQAARAAAKSAATKKAAAARAAEEPAGAMQAEWDRLASDAAARQAAARRPAHRAGALGHQPATRA